MSDPRRNNPTTWAMAFADLFGRRARLELDLVGAVVSDPAAGVPNAREAGVSAASFESEDLRLVFAAAEVLYDNRLLDGRPDATGQIHGTDADRLRCYDLAKRAIRAEGWWNDNAIAASRGPDWSDASLSGLFDSFPAVAAVVCVRLYGSRLARLAGVGRDARDHLRYAWRLLTEDEEAAA